MKKSIVRVFKEDDVEIDLETIIKKLNSLSNTIKFKVGKKKFSIDEKEIKVENDYSMLALSNKILNESKNDYKTIFITNKKDENNYFFRRINNEYNKTILSLHGWKNLTSYSKNTGVFYFIVNILLLDIDSGNDRHDNDNTTECIYNFYWDKTEISDGIKSAIICDSCQESVMNKVNKNQQVLVDDIMLILEELKKANSYNNILEYWTQDSKQRVKIFFSYAHEDREYLNEFKDYIKIFERNGLVERWDDNELVVGEKWDNTIKDKIYSADIVVFLLSASSLASDYINDYELKIAFELNDMDEVYVIPIIIKDCLWDMTGFSDFQILPIDGKAVNSWRLREEAWTATARGLKKAIDNIIVAKESISIVKEESIDKGRDKLFSDEPVNELNTIVLNFLKTYKRWWFNIPRIINWGSEREGFRALKDLTEEKLKAILRELEDEDKIVSKFSTKNKNSFLYKAK